MIAIPLIYSVYLGIAEAARDLAVKQAAKRRADGHVAYLLWWYRERIDGGAIGPSGNDLRAAAANEPGFGTTPTAS